LGGSRKAWDSGHIDDCIGQYELALAHKQKAFQLDPSNVGYLIGGILTKANLINARGQDGSHSGVDKPEVRALAAKALEMDGLDADNRADAYAAYAGSFQKARQMVPWQAKAIESSPFAAIYRENRATNYHIMGEYGLEQADRTAARQLRSASIADMKARRLAASSDTSTGKAKEVVSLAEEACRLTEYKYWSYLNTLAGAEAAAGNMAEAEHWGSEALKLAPENEKSDLSARLRSYRGGGHSSIQQ
jgi:tetratricopeptide (TPR) repeat protein